MTLNDKSTVHRVLKLREAARTLYIPRQYNFRTYFPIQNFSTLPLPDMSHISVQTM